MFFTDNTNDLCHLWKFIRVLKFHRFYTQLSTEICLIYERKFNLIIIKQSKDTIELEYHI